MARFEMLDANSASLGEGPAAGDVLFELGMMYSVGRDVPVDLVTAHKWFNLAAVRGNADARAASRCRRSRSRRRSARRAIGSARTKAPRRSGAAR